MIAEPEVTHDQPGSGFKMEVDKLSFSEDVGKSGERNCLPINKSYELNIKDIEPFHVRCLIKFFNQLC